MLQPSRLRLALVRVAPIIAEVRATGTTSLRAIAAELNSRGIPAPRGGRCKEEVEEARCSGRYPRGR
jgi:hypothetical protein